MDDDGFYDDDGLPRAHETLLAHVATALLVVVAFGVVMAAMSALVLAVR